MPLPSVMGSEIEYGITVQGDPDFDPISSCVLLVNAYQDNEDAQILWDYEQENPLADARGFHVEGEKYTPNQQENIARNKTLRNGARFYVDHAHPEYSTPEVTNVRDLIAYERAGERTMEAARRAATALLPGGQTLLIHKNNSDRKGNSYGNHENYLIERRTPFREIVEHMTPFLITRNIFCGAGKVGSENRSQQCDFQISQRADFFETEVALDTMVKRPIINTRDEPHADREKYRRFHVIIGDSNLSEVSTYLRTGVTSIVLALVEDGAIPRSLSVNDPVKVVKEVSHDLACKRQYPLERGGRADRDRDPEGAPRQRAALLLVAQPRPDHQGRDGALGARAGEARRGPAPARPRGRLGDQAQADQELHRAAQGRLAPPAGGHARPAVPRRPAGQGSVLPARAPRRGRPDRRARGDRARRDRSAQRYPRLLPRGVHSPLS